MFGPMFDPPESPLAMPLLAIGVVGLLIGLAWLRRLAVGDGEPQSFRATASNPRDYLPLVAIGAVVGLLATVFVITR